MEANTSDIDSLPNELKPAENIKMSVSETNNNNKNVITELSKESISQIVSGLQEASNSQLTGLPSKHIPNQNSQVSFDPNVRVNHIPRVEEEKRNYIEDDNTLENMIERSNQQDDNTARLEPNYDELQTTL